MARTTINSLLAANQPLSMEVTIDNGLTNVVKLGVMGYWDVAALLKDKHPFDALQVTLRANAYLSAAHGIAAAKALEEITGIRPNFNGLLVRNILLAGEYIYYHLTHFYQGVLFTFPGTKQNNTMVENYWQSVSIRAGLQEMMAVFSGKAPHHVTTVPGGFSQLIDAKKIIKVASHIRSIQNFVEERYASDVRVLARQYPQWSRIPVGIEGYLSVAGFPQKLLKTGEEENFLFIGAVRQQSGQREFEIEQIGLDSTNTFSLAEGGADSGDSDHYSWVKVARVNEEPVEVGSLARAVINGWQLTDDPDVVSTSVIGREMIKVYECLYLLAQISTWLDYLEPAEPLISAELVVPEEGEGTGKAESPAGPVIHRVKVTEERITDYEIIEPVAFNLASAEQALKGVMVADSNSPQEIIRILKAME